MDRLDNTIRPYAWGSVTAIPELRGVEPTGEPQAELWMGAHPAAPSRLDRGQGPVPLDDVIGADPDRELGPETHERFGPRLPFLVKLLAAGAPLSLQVHPDAATARAGYAEEEARGVPADDPGRNYKDTGHKPELLCALTPFEGLCGFRHPEDAARLLAGLGVDSLEPYADILATARPGDDALREVLTALLTADRDAVAPTVDAAGTAAAHAARRTGDDDTARAYETCASLARAHPGDPGVLASLLLHRIRLLPGEAVHLGAGVPHAYLEGLGVEIMANSDNVLRCGLTSKHIDVPELLRVVRFHPGDPEILRPEAGPGGEEVYDTPAEEFRLSRHVLAPGAPAAGLPAGRPQILLATGGRVHLASDGDELTLESGESAYAPACEKVTASGTGTLFRATVAV